MLKDHSQIKKTTCVIIWGLLAIIVVLNQTYVHATTIYKLVVNCRFEIQGKMNAHRRPTLEQFEQSQSPM